MDIVGLRGDKARLVPVDKRVHMENALRWMNDPEVTQYLLLVMGVTPGMEEQWMDRVQKRDVEYVWAIMDAENRHIGFTGLHGIDWRLRLATTGTVIGEKSAWGQGYGTDVMRIRTKFAFEILNLHRLQSEARIDNIASQRALEKVGYKREGTARKKLYYGGRWYDTILYAILDEDYFARVH